MSRPKKDRCIRCNPNASYVKPRAIPLIHLQEVSIGMDGLEALRLADYEGRHHEEAAREMEISRATFGRILSQARHTVAEALTQGKALKIETNTHHKEDTE